MTIAVELQRRLPWLGDYLRGFAFRRVCAQNGLTLDYARHRDSAFVLFEVWRERVYADLFPFYEDAVVVDVGAQYGLFSLFAARHLGAGGRVVAYEPAPTNVDVWRANLAANPADVTPELVEAAVTGDGREVTLHLGHAAQHSIRDRERRGGGSVTVPSFTLASLLARHELDRVDFLKLDCEGAEFEILLQADDATLARIETISMEYHGSRTHGHAARPLVRRLVGAGFRVAKWQTSPTGANIDHGKLVVTRFPLDG